VRQSQQALLCDRCEFWHHRTCDRTIDQKTYRQLIKENQTFEWSCKSCSEVSEGPPSPIEVSAYY
jgi:hypothetical protein